MAKFDLKFIDLIDENDFISVKADNQLNNTYIPKECISIRGEYSENEFFIVLDKSTAIKFAKTLRTEINKIKDEDNG